MKVGNLLPTVSLAQSSMDAGYDAVLACGEECISSVPQYKQTISDVMDVDEYVEDVRLLQCSAAPGKRLVFANTGFLSLFDNCVFSVFIH